MKTLGRVTISAMLIIYSFIGFAILSPLITALVNNSIFFEIGLLFSSSLLLFFFLISRPFTVRWKGIFSHLEEREVARTWLLLHSLFTHMTSYVYISVAAISSIAPLFLVDLVDLFPRNFMSVWIITLFSIIGLWSLHLAIGMGYRWFCKGIMVGIPSFSSLALQSLRNKQRKGIEYLLTAFLLLQDYLKSEELELQELNKAIKAARCFLLFKSEIPYDSLEMVALEFQRFPSMGHLRRVLSAFAEDSKVQWTLEYTETQRAKRTVLELLGAIAALLSGLAFLPETARSGLIESLLSIGSVEKIQFIIGIFLTVVVAYISMLVEDYRLSPFEARRFTFSEMKQLRPKKTIGS